MKIAQLTLSAFALTVCFVWAAPSHLMAQKNRTVEPQRKDFVSDASFAVGAYKYAKDQDHSVATMVKAANAFLNSLDEDTKKIAMHPLDSPERFEWTNLPAKPDAGGVRMGDLTKDQLKLACDLIAATMSKQGFRKMRDIMLADDQLLKNGKPRRGFGTENFSLVIFATPSETEPWAFQIDGHHVGVNLAIAGDKLTMSPSFIGTQPHMFKIGRQRFKPFANETDYAYELVRSLNDEQIKTAVVGDTRARIKTGPGADWKIPNAKGLECSKLNDTQKATLVKLISQWVNDLPEAQATKRMEEVKSEIDQMKFSWNGNKEPGSDISYTIQSPSLIIEYACQDLGGNPLDHLHSMYRNPKNEYGGQLKQK